MELNDYLRAAKRRWWILALIPLLAAGAVVGYQVSRPPMYEATATVAAPALVGGASSNQYSGSAGPKTFVANFQAVLTSSAILQRVSDELKIKKSAVSSGLSSSQVGLSSVMKVTFQSANRGIVGPVAGAAARQTLLFLFQTQVDVAKQPFDAAQHQLDTVTAELDQFAKASTTPVPDRDYQILATEISNLDTQAAAAIAANNAIVANGLAPQIAAKKQQLAQLATVLSTYMGLKEKQTQAVTELNSSNQTYQQARAQLGAANPDQVLSLGATGKVSPITASVPAAGMAFGSALAFALAMVALLELSRARRARAVEALEVSGAPVEADVAVEEQWPAAIVAEVAEERGESSEPAMAASSIELADPAPVLSLVHDARADVEDAFVAATPDVTEPETVEEEEPAAVAGESWLPKPIAKRAPLWAFPWPDRAT